MSDLVHSRKHQLMLFWTAVMMLRPGGTLVYSTCTFNPLENEQLVADVLERYPLELRDAGVDIGGPGLPDAGLAEEQRRCVHGCVGVGGGSRRSRSPQAGAARGPGPAGRSARVLHRHLPQNGVHRGRVRQEGGPRRQAEVAAQRPRGKCTVCALRGESGARRQARDACGGKHARSG